MRLLLAICLFVGLESFACNCDALLPVSLDECFKYPVIVEGRITNVDDAKIEVRVLNSFKGLYEKEAVFNYSEQDGCIQNYETGEEWLFYARKNNAQDLIIEYCSRSRKVTAEGQKDFVAEMTGHTYFQEKSFLEEKLGTIDLSKKNLRAKAYEKVSVKTTSILIGSSLVFMLIGFLIIKKLKKNSDN